MPRVLLISAVCCSRVARSLQNSEGTFHSTHATSASDISSRCFSHATTPLTVVFSTCIALRRPSASAAAQPVWEARQACPSRGLPKAQQVRQVWKQPRPLAGSVPDNTVRPPPTRLILVTNAAAPLTDRPPCSMGVVLAPPVVLPAGWGAACTRASSCQQPAGSVQPPPGLPALHH